VLANSPTTTVLAPPLKDEAVEVVWPLDGVLTTTLDI
jgi:hypothetical protein